MRRRFCWRTFLMVLLTFLCGAPLTAITRDDILSPVEGVWGNVQPLVIHVDDGSEIYYSVSGSDPMLFGFAYDGPAIIPQRGDVTLRITCISPDGVRTDFEVSYTVAQPSMKDYSAEEKNLVRLLSTSSIRTYTSGTVMPIPQSFKYHIICKKETQAHWFTGGRLQLDSKSNLERYIPFELERKSEQGIDRYRFVVLTSGSALRYTHEKHVPFSITDWTALSFDSASYLYSLDGGDWTDELTTVYITRFVPHVVRWKKKDADDVEISSFTLPVKPDVIATTERNGALTLSFTNSSEKYTFGRVKNSFSTLNALSGFYETVTADVFYGEEFAETVRMGIYASGVYQGAMDIPLFVDRLPPDTPVVSSRKIQSKTIISVGNGNAETAFISLSTPVVLSDLNHKNLDALLSLTSMGDFSPLPDKELELSAVSGRPTAYRVQAYSADRSGNKSGTVEISVLVDGNNCYVNPSPLDSSLQRDGSFACPFRTLEEAVAFTNRNSGMTVHLLGDIQVSRTLSVTSDTVLQGDGHILYFNQNAGITVDGASLSLEKCTIEKKDIRPEETRFVIVDSGSLKLWDCSVCTEAEMNFIVIDAYHSDVRIVRSSVTLLAASYGCLVAATDSEVQTTSSQFAVSAHSAVCFCTEESTVSLAETVEGVTCSTGHAVECAGGTLSLKSNTFTASYFDCNRRNEAVWTDETTELVLNLANRYRGFKQ